MKEMFDVLKENRLTIASCESLSAGLFCAELASLPGTSSLLCGGVVSYMTRIKESVVGVESSIIEKDGVISMECALSMAKHIQMKMQSDIGVSCTGNAGPDVMEGKPVGCVYIAVYYQNKEYGRKLLLNGSRNEIREQTVFSMCKFVVDVVSQKGE